MKLRYYLATGFYCAFLFWISHQSRPPGADLSFDGADKLAHFVVYALLSGLIYTGLHRSPKEHGKWAIFLIPVIFSALYGVSDEFHQLFVPGRTFSISDMVADALGAVAGAAICRYWFGGRHPRGVG